MLQVLSGSVVCRGVQDFLHQQDLARNTNAEKNKLISSDFNSVCLG